MFLSCRLWVNTEMLECTKRKERSEETERAVYDRIGADRRERRERYTEHLIICSGEQIYTINLLRS